MIYLQKAVALLNANDALTQENYGYMKPENIFDSLQSAKVFVIRGHDIIYEPSKKEVEDSLLPFSLPFEACWFEVFDGAIVSFHDVMGTLHMIRGVLIEEVEPGRFNYFIYCHNSKNQEACYTGFDGMPLDGNKWANQFLVSLMNYARGAALHILNRLNNTDSMALVSTHEKLKMKTSKGKIFHKVRKIIYVVPKKDRGKPIPGVGGEVDWTHRWMVRGHWRKIEGLGKNRSGEYCVKNFTWVTEHEKGPENMPLVADKVRVLKEDKNARE